MLRMMKEKMQSEATNISNDLFGPMPGDKKAMDAQTARDKAMGTQGMVDRYGRPVK